MKKFLIFFVLVLQIFIYLYYFLIQTLWLLSFLFPMFLGIILNIFNLEFFEDIVIKSHGTDELFYFLPHSILYLFCMYKLYTTWHIKNNYFIYLYIIIPFVILVYGLSNSSFFYFI